MSSSPRLRFAPSPTGSLHLGNARTALVNWLAARAQGGTLLLRIEDTDTERTQAGAEAAILQDLEWLGIDWDEGPGVGGEYGPYRQSERGALYEAATLRLLEISAAYRCFCDRDQLDAERRAARDRGETTRYPGFCRQLDAAEATRRHRAGEPSVVRFRAPERAVRFADRLRGETGVGAGEVEDFIIQRADGRPTYQLAVVVDDHAMAITHVVRGQDHLSNTPRQLLLYEALGWEPPVFAHLPLVLGPDRSRLSKRHGATSVAAMRQRGILSEALVNTLALLGWGPPDDHEVLTLEELLAVWDLEALSAANAVFDFDKLEWLNQQHLLRLTPEEVLRRAESFLAVAGLAVPASGQGRDWWVDVVDLLRLSCTRLSDLPARAEALFEEPSERVVEADRAHEQSALHAFVAASERGALACVEGFRAAAGEISAATGARGRGLFHPLRVALTGAQQGPELARLVPLIERGAELGIEPRVADVATRLRRVLGAPG